MFSDFNRPAHRRGPAIDGSHHRQGWMLFNKLPRDELRYWPMFRLADFADVAQQAERGHAMAEATSSRLVIRSTSGVSMHSEPRDMVLAERDVRDPWPGHVQRDTTSDGMLAFGHSRSGSPWPS